MLLGAHLAALVLILLRVLVAVIALGVVALHLAVALTVVVTAVALGERAVRGDENGSRCDCAAIRFNSFKVSVLAPLFAQKAMRGRIAPDRRAMFPGVTFLHGFSGQRDAVFASEPKPSLGLRGYAAAPGER